MHCMQQSLKYFFLFALYVPMLRISTHHYVHPARINLIVEPIPLSFLIFGNGMGGIAVLPA